MRYTFLVDVDWFMMKDSVLGFAKKLKYIGNCSHASQRDLIKVKKQGSLQFRRLFRRFLTLRDNESKVDF